MRKDWPSIRREGNGKYVYYVADFRPYKLPERFKTEKEAEGRAQVVKMELLRNGTSQAILSPDLRADALRAQEELIRFNLSCGSNLTIYEVVKAFISQNERGIQLVNDAVAQWVEVKRLEKERKEISKETYNGLRHRIDRFNKSYGARMLREIDLPLIERWLLSLVRKVGKKTEGLITTVTRKNYKIVLYEFFRWCMKQGFIDNNPCELISIRLMDDKETDVLTLKQVESMIEVCLKREDKDQMIPYLLTGLFCGLRPKESQRLLCEDFNFETKELRIKPGATKTKSRYVKMNEDLCKVLQPMLEGRTGPMVDPVNWRKRWDAVKKQSIQGRWASDVLRHSFASYWMPLHQNIQMLKDIMGNSEWVIRKNYKRALPRREADAFWGILARLAAQKEHRQVLPITGGED